MSVDTINYAVNGRGLSKSPSFSPVSNPASAIRDTEVVETPPPSSSNQSEVALKAAVEKINQQLAAQQTNLTFSVDKDSGKVVVKIIDIETKKVLRQMPSEEILKINEALSNLKSGLLPAQQA